MNRRNKPRVKLILNAPDKVSAQTKLGSNIVTILCWVVYIYLWIPLITLIAWAVGATHAYDELAFVRQVGDFRELVVFYGMVVALLGGGLLLWALKEYLRFRNANRRRPRGPATHAELASHTSATETDVERWQSLRRMIALHDENGKVMGVHEQLSSAEATPPQPT
ncbi:MAG: poly-beta-1,6-N-acetyl-D-glucosamine biosynthesis protein PgaD [Oxalicibacterium faecigallinarum]|uniref:poly-beta-1,6-N-acetyl-D-glucosamine biosynthesis protein PgaD n=1 Tax=Oxalicibacterium faecigallinarum TaxID=573741 RepID=UPI002807CFAD|nr:poly-beta-1,6-N-acetyl-D-glucosamine biosynthesis protein PgaD [Oxalicibacterium faecigallinarum]MDQ7970317.1 poly-beta-1,6-N-acetyl-D-glucosamine biosynthesis protein PgaD [Oxalicibacterium faecigallinarum]